MAGCAVVTSGTLDGGGEFLIGELYTGDGVGALGCEFEICIPVLKDRDLAKIRVRGTGKREILIYQVGEPNALAFFDPHLRWREMVTVLWIGVIGSEFHRRRGSHPTRGSSCLGHRDGGFDLWSLPTGECKAARKGEGDICGVVRTTNDKT